MTAFLPLLLTELVFAALLVDGKQHERLIVTSEILDDADSTTLALVAYRPT